MLSRKSKQVYIYHSRNFGQIRVMASNDLDMSMKWLIKEYAPGEISRKMVLRKLVCCQED